MSNRWWLRGAAALAGVAPVTALLGCGGAGQASASSSPGGSCQGSAGVASATTPNYIVAMQVGEPEMMYSPQQVAASHPSTGEVMLGGMMADVSGANAHHLEAHICRRSTGAVLTGAQPTITLTDTTAGTTPQNVPVAVMQGVDAGTSDYHYGNNVTFMPGHSYTVTVRINGETAVLQYKSS